MLESAIVNGNKNKNRYTASEECCLKTRNAYSIVNGNKNTDTEKKKAKKMWQKLFTKCHKLTKIRSCKCYRMNASVS